MSRSVHVTKIYMVLELKNQALISTFSDTLIVSMLSPSHSSLIPIQTTMNGLLLDSIKLDSDTINSIALILAQTPTFLFKK